MQSIENIIKTVCGYFNEEGIDYALVGGATLPILGAPRSTFDVDVIARIDESGVKSLVEHLKSEGFLASEKDLIAALMDESHCSIDYKEPPYRIDLKGAYSEKEEDTIANSKQLEYLGLKVKVQSPEDAIANKLLFGSEQDLKDALSIYVRQMPSLDTEYLRKACDKLKVRGKLESLMARAKSHI